MKKVIEKRKVTGRKKTDRSTKSFIYIFSFLFIAFGIFTSVIYAQNYIKNKDPNKVTDSYVLSRLAKLAEIPNEDPVYIAKIKDDENFKKDLEVYAAIKKGDYVIVFKEKAYVFDLNNNVLVKVIEFNE